MTELEKMQRAKLYIDKLANGIDPITDMELPEDGTLNQVRLSRCFFYVSDVLRQVIENGGTVIAPKATGKPAFFLTEEQRRAFPYSKEPLRVTEIVNRLNALVSTKEMRKIVPVAITNWLLLKGFLERATMPGGKSARRPTKQGEQIGLASQLRQSPDGEYYAVVYNEDAQRFVLDNLGDICANQKNKG